MSSSARSGNVNLYTFPVTGSTDAGPVEPLQLPSELAQITNQRFVSIGLPGPSISSHQPGEGSSAFDAACAPGERPVRTKIALSRAALSVPQVSYASRAPVSAPPRFIRNGEDRSKNRVASGMRAQGGGGGRELSVCVPGRQARQWIFHLHR